jgi:nucleoside-diphosphate-sugar epimerase
VSAPRHVLVTGAAGLLGRDVLAELRRAGVSVTALELHDPGDLAADRVVVGSAADVETVRDALAGVDAIVHLAAIRAPTLGTAEAVFLGNVSATFTVLEQGGQAGVRRAVIASSYSITGLPWAPGVRHPAYLPIDERLPLQIEDPYGLSKQVDELVAGMLWWRHGLSVVALRFPFLGRMEAELAERAAGIAADPGGFAARELWTYLDTRDAARATVLGLTEPPPGCHVVAIAAPNTLAPYPTEQLLDVYHPAVPRRTPFPGRAAPVDLARARGLLGWEPEHLWAGEERDLGEEHTACP